MHIEAETNVDLKISGTKLILEHRNPTAEVYQMETIELYQHGALEKVGQWIQDQVLKVRETVTNG